MKAGRVKAGRVKAHRLKTLSARVHDLKDLLEYSKQTDADVADAIVTMLCCADGRTLAALGQVLKFVTRCATRRPR